MDAKATSLSNPESISELVAYYTFDDVQAGKITDHSASGFHGSWSTGAYYVQGEANVPTAIEDIKSADAFGFKVYPNPANDYFKVSVSTEKTALYKIDLINIAGSVLNTKTVELTSNTDVRFNTSELNKGVYIVNITSEGVSKAMRVIIK